MEWRDVLLDFNRFLYDLVPKVKDLNGFCKFEALNT